MTPPALARRSLEAADVIQLTADERAELADELADVRELVGRGDVP